VHSSGTKSHAAGKIFLLLLFFCVKAKGKEERMKAGGSVCRTLLFQKFPKN
jgi:hypothetical protein